MFPRMLTIAAGSALGVLVSQAAGAVPEPPAASAARGAILSPGEGDFMAFCDTPHLDVTIKVGARQNSSSMEMGTARLAAGTSNFGRHRVDEIIYFVAGQGFASIADDRTPVRPGSTMFIPRNIRHGFENSGSDVLEFVWVASPTGFEQGLRSVGVPSLSQCKSRPK